MSVPALNYGACLSKPLRFPPRYGGLLVVALLLLQLPLWINPGYFSHDELQWGARAAVPFDQIRFVSFSNWASFQFRPLTFNLWLLLSHLLFETPRLFHALFVLMGSLNALMLATLLRRAGLRPNVAFCAALVFGLSPFAVWVHGWIGCLADLIWVAASLGLVLLLQGLGSGARAAGLAAASAVAATAIGLYAKEAALSMPALLALGTLLLRFPRSWLAATASSAILVLVYLFLRLDVLLHPEQASTYTVDLLVLPQRWLEYQVFPWAFGVSEIHVLALASNSRWGLLVMGLLGLVWCMTKASPRLSLAWLGGGLLALAPVLVLPASSNQYGYGFMALVCGVTALAWPKFSGRQQIIMGLLIGVTVLHGFQIQLRMLQTGRLQAVFSDSLAAAVQAESGGTVRLWPEQLGQRPIYARLSHDIPAWRGIAIDAHVSMANNAQEATHRVLPDGSVLPRETMIDE